VEDGQGIWHAFEEAKSVVLCDRKTWRKETFLKNYAEVVG
jgi:hypothetical protein